MDEPKLKVGDRVRHNSTKNAPAMVVVEIRDKLNVLGNIHCSYWHNDEFKTKSFIELELNRLAAIQP